MAGTGETDRKLTEQRKKICSYKKFKVSAAKETGPYPSRRGVILVTSDKYKNLIPTGHAAIVWDKNNVIESVSKGVVLGKNNWKATKYTYSR